MENTYNSIIQKLDGAYRTYLEVIRSELAKNNMFVVNPVQTLLMLNIGEQNIIIRELMERGYYHGTNVSYNLKKLVELGYIEQVQNQYDKRSYHVKLTDKGLELINRVKDATQKQTKKLAKNDLSHDKLSDVVETLTKLEKFWQNVAMTNR